MKNRDLFKEAKEQIEITRKLFEKGISLKSEFIKLTYPEKLKFMDKYFGGASGAGEDPESMEPIILVFPNEKEPDGITPNKNYRDEIRLYNEWEIKLFEGLDPTISLEFSFERLKKRFENHISDIKKMGNTHPEKSISDYIQGQIKEYNEKIKSKYIQVQFNEYGGAWDLTKKVIGNLPSFLKARTYYNYISFLENWSDSIIESMKKEVDNLEDTDHSLIAFKHRKTFDGILKKCNDNLTNLDFNNISYAALYAVIYNKYYYIFAKKTPFIAFQKLLDQHFKTDTKTYKLNKVKEKAEELKDEYRWIDLL